MIHVLFSSAAGSLAQVLDARGIGDEVAFFTDALDWGPVPVGNSENRQAWLDHHSPIDEDGWDWLPESIIRFRAAIATNTDRLVWISPRNAQDLSGLHWFLSEFGGEGVRLIAPEHPISGTWRNEPPLRLGELQLEQIAELFDTEPRKSWDATHFPAARWLELSGDPALLRIVEGGSLCNAREDYFDRWLLERCPTELVKAHRVVGDAMGHLWDLGHDTDPAMLFWRLRELIRSGLVESEGRLPQFGEGSAQTTKVRRLA